MSKTWDTGELARWYSVQFGVSRSRAEDFATAHASIFGAKDPSGLSRKELRKVRDLANYN